MVVIYFFLPTASTRARGCGTSARTIDRPCAGRYTLSFEPRLQFPPSAASASQHKHTFPSLPMDMPRSPKDTLENTTAIANIAVGSEGFGVSEASVEQSVRNSDKSKLFKHFLGANGPYEKASKEQCEEFIGDIEGFCSDIGETLKSLESLVGGVELRKVDKKYDADVRGKEAIKEDAAAIKHYEEILGDWCDTIEQYLEEKQTESNSGGADAGPLTEVEYWRRRMQRLTNITEQLKTKDCKNVIQILTSVTKGSESTANGASYALLRRWKQIDVRITEHANEAKGTSKNMHPCTSQ